MLTNQVTKKSSAEKFPSTSKYSDRSRSDDATHTVSLDTEFRAVSNPDEVVAPEDKVKAYKVTCNWHERVFQLCGSAASAWRMAFKMNT